ncbi:MAG: hypothetical protein V4615_07425 [Bacteroidota bacterium]
MNYLKAGCLCLFVVSIIMASSCKKKPDLDAICAIATDSCLCAPLHSTFESLSSLSDSNEIRATLRGSWTLKCSKYHSRYGYISYGSAEIRGTDTLDVVFTDSTYACYVNDSLLYNQRYSLIFGMYLAGSNFFSGVLSSDVKYMDSMIGISATIPYTGSQYLIFKRK